MSFNVRFIRRGALAVAACLALAGCESDSGGDDARASLDPMPQAVPTDKVDSSPLNAVVGQGSVKVALILPQSAQGNAGSAAQSMRNAAELALAEFNTPDVQLVVKDDGGTAQGARTAAQSAMDEGAKLVIGPLFAHSVVSAGQLTKQRNVPMLAFSTDGNVASRGVYLLSFMPESDVQRIVSYAVAQGKRSFAALIPETGYGSVVEAAFQTAVAKAGGRVVGLEHYSSDKAKMSDAVGRLATTLSQADALLIPDTAEGVQQVVGVLATNGVNLQRLQLLGTGLWDDPAMMRDASLSGAWYAAPDDRGFRSFAQRYQAKYGSTPARTASLAYDATSLVAAVVKAQGPNALTDDTFASASGFSGVDGAFRFKPDGANERGLAVYKVQAGGPVIVSPAPTSFEGQTAQAAGSAGQEN